MSSLNATTPKILIIGAGMSGMLMGIRLQQAGIHDFEILEKAHTLGGTWRENTYPGLQCDVPGYMYAYSFEPNPECSRRFATGADLQAYFERVFAKYGLARHTRFNTAVESVTWENDGWTVVTGDGERRRADIVVAATGVLHHPNVPDIPGIKDFAGTAMHSAQCGTTCRLPAGVSASSAPARPPCRSSVRLPAPSATSTYSSARPSGSCRPATGRSVSGSVV